MDNNKDSWVREEIFRISFDLSGSYLKYVKGDLQLKGKSGLKMIDYFINDYFCDLINDLKELESSSIALSVKQQDLIKNCYAIIKQETKLILEYIESNLQTVESNLKNNQSYLQENKLILTKIEYTFQKVDSMSDSPERAKTQKEALIEVKKECDIIIENYNTTIANNIKDKAKLFELKEKLMELCSIPELQLEEEERKSTSELRSTSFNINNFISYMKSLLSTGLMALYSIPELQKLQLEEDEIKLKEDEIKPTLEAESITFNINNFISDIKNLLSKEQIYYYKQSAEDAGLSTKEFNNFILTSLIPELNDSISRISKQEKLNENQSKDVADLTNYITSFKEEILNENKNHFINNILIDPIPVQNKAVSNVKGNSTKSLKESMCRIL